MGGQRQRRSSDSGSGVGLILEACVLIGVLGGIYVAVKHAAATHFHQKPCPHTSANIVTHAGTNAVLHCFNSTALATAAPYVVDVAVGALAGVLVGISIVLLARIFRPRRKW